MDAASNPKKSNHRVNIVRVGEVLPHNNADTLELIPIPGTSYQVVSKMGQFVPGDLAIYIQPDSVVPQTEPFRFIWGQYVPAEGFNHGHDMAYAANKDVPERRRRITVRKFRGQWSEGLLLPVSDFLDLDHTTFGYPEVGTDVSDLLGITHYDPDTADGTASTKAQQEGAPRRKYPKTWKGWLYFVLSKLGFRRATDGYVQDVSFHLPTYDVESFKNHSGDFEATDDVVITEKIHGSNARYICLDGEMYQGSRNQWKKAGDHVWSKALAANPWIEKWCREHEGYALYGEVTPTQKGFDYGATKDKPKFFIFDIRTPDGEWLGDLDELWYDTPDEHRVPFLYMGPFDKEYALGLVDGKSLVEEAKHIREGVVIRRLHRADWKRSHRQLKLVSNSFLEKDSKPA